MKLLLENWRQFLNERRITNSRDDFTCPEEDKYGSVYYDVDRDNPPTIEQIAKCYVLNDAKVTERSVSGLNPALYNTEELTKFREYDKENLRAVQRDDGSFEELKADIKENRTIVNRIYHLDRGYEFLEKKLKKCKAKIKRL